MTHTAPRWSRKMLTDIFANRYVGVTIWPTFGESERRLLCQCFKIIDNHLYPYWNGKPENPRSAAAWQSIHDKLGTELGLKHLSPKYYSYQTMWMNKPWTQTGEWPLYNVCENFMCASPASQDSPDQFMKERISFVELAFRQRQDHIGTANLEISKQIRLAAIEEAATPSTGNRRLPGKRVNALLDHSRRINDEFEAAVEELNERFRLTGKSLNYHNGFIQIASDELVQSQIETPFWTIASDPRWENVDIDMKEAIDRRDSGNRDSALYAARALENTIKVISDDKGWTHGKEDGAHGYIDNLGSKDNGFISAWEREILEVFFTNVRNPLVHRPGNAPMPELTLVQANWAIEFCMSWIKSLIQRL